MAQSKVNWIENLLSSTCRALRGSPERYLSLLSCVAGVGRGCVGLSNLREVWDSSQDRGVELRTRSRSVRCLSWGTRGRPIACSCDAHCRTGSSRILCGRPGLVRTRQREPAALGSPRVTTVRVQAGSAWSDDRGHWGGDAAVVFMVDRWWDVSSGNPPPLLDAVLVLWSLRVETGGWEQNPCWPRTNVYHQCQQVVG